MFKISRDINLISLASLLVVLAGAVYNGYMLLANGIATKRDIEQHDQSPHSHIEFLKELDALTYQIRYIESRSHENREEAISIAAILVRQTAADAEPDKRLKAAAGAYYETQFRHLMRHENASIHDSINTSLNQPWYGKPRR